MSSLDVRAIDTNELREKKAPAVKQSFRVFLAEGAFDRAVARGTTDTTREVGGVLVGEVLRDAAGPYLLIETTVDALHADEKGAELTFTHATWEHINKEMDSHHQGKRVVGWYHTHPGFGVFLSDRDQFIHRSFFNLPFQVAFVYDPRSREHGMFTWHDNEVVRARRYWVGDREQLWDAPRQVEAKDGKRKEPSDRDDPEREAPAPARATEPPLFEGPGSLAMLVGVGVVLLLVGGFIGNWWGASSANRVIEQAQAQVAKAKVDAVEYVVNGLDAELVGVLRDSLGDATMRRSLALAVAELDGAIAELEGKPRPADDATRLDPRGGAPAPAGPGSASALAAAGSASAPAAGSGAGTPSAGSLTPTAAAGSTAAPGVAASPRDRLQASAAMLRGARDRLIRIAEDRAGAEVVLAQLDRRSRSRGRSTEELGRDVAEQRSGLGTLYAEIASDVAKTDKARAKRLLSIAAHIDPGNRARYEQQLRTFDKTASLPPDTGAAMGSGGTK